MKNKISADATNIPLDSILDAYQSPSEPETYTPVEELDSSIEVYGKSENAYAIEVEHKEDDTAKTVEAVVAVIEEYNVKYGLKLPTSINNIREIIKSIASKVQRDVYAVALSEAADRIILATTGNMLVTIGAMVQELSEEQASGIMTLEQRVGILDRFMIYTEKMLDIRDRLKVDNPRIAIEAAIRNDKYENGGGRGDDIDIAKIDDIIGRIHNR